jgi:hypothetical protein
MRRSKIITNKILILLILSGLFNLFSFAFDQLVIQSELKMRDLDRKMRLNRVNIEDLSYSLNTINDLSIEIRKTSNSFRRDLSVILISLTAFDLSSNNAFTDFYNEESIMNIQKNYLKKFNELIIDFNYKTNEIYKMFKENFSSGIAFEKFSHETNYKEILKIKDLIIDENMHIALTTYLNALARPGDILDEEYMISYDILKNINNKIKNLSLIGGKNLHNLLLLTGDEYSNQFNAFYEFLDIYASNQNKINYFILFGIISQIIGILFILLLFKELLKKNINLK